MKEVKVNKVGLLGTLRSNRDAHRAIFEEALVGYRETAEKMLEEHLAEIRAGKVKQVYVHLPQPEDHTRDYDRVIAMLTMCVDDEVVLDERSFAQYVQDDWAWKRQFLTSNSAYSGTAQTHLNELDY